jgi:predicted RNA-binding Zn-ribbon protein involved in translation (DUF1610 family)
MYDNCKVYGPYDRKDGRQHVIVIFKDGSRKTVSYPKYLVEKRLDRYLTDDETVDHLDGDPSNLQVLSRSEHIKLDVKRLNVQQFPCPMCGEEFELVGPKLSKAIQNRKQGKSGPFCGRSCAGKYGAEVQNGRMGSLDVEEIDPEYSTLKNQ